MMKSRRIAVLVCLLTAVVLGSSYLGGVTSERKASAQGGTGGGNPPRGKVTLKQGKSMTEKAKKVTSQGPNPNIKNDTVENDPNAKTRGFGPYRCGIHVDNRSDLKIWIYVDGEKRDLVGSYGDLYLYTGNGPTTIYGIAYFTDGSSSEWGPQVIGCQAGYWSSWTLWP